MKKQDKIRRFTIFNMCPRDKRVALTGYGFLFPFLICFIAVFMIPIVLSIIKSFYKLSGNGGLYGGAEGLQEKFVGFDNYIWVVQSEKFWHGIGRVLLFALFQIPFMIIGALILALILDSFLIKRIAFYRLSFFLPFAIPGIIAAIMWLYLYTPTLSPLYAVIPKEFSFLDRNIVLFSMANMTTWTYTGYNMLIFLAALTAVPTELYEAARIDGASGFQIVTKIKIPLVSKAVFLTVLLSIIGTVQLFNEPSVLASRANWMGADYTPMMMAYNTMMGSLSPSGDGPASAVTIMMALIAGTLAIIYASLQKKEA